MFTTDMTYGKPQYLPVDIKHPQILLVLMDKVKKRVKKSVGNIDKKV